MIHIITQENRHLFHHALVEMHRQRKAVFIDAMGWALKAPQGLEIDDFDSENATYLVEAAEPRARITCSMRLLRTDGPHLLGDVFGALCEHQAPRSATIWEVSRFCPAPETPKGEPRRQMLARMISAVLEAGLLFGMEEATFVASAALAPLAMKVGWQARALGPAQRIGRERLTAIAARISAEGLREVRARNAITGPLTRFLPGALPRAA